MPKINLGQSAETKNAGIGIADDRLSVRLGSRDKPKKWNIDLADMTESDRDEVITFFAKWVKKAVLDETELKDADISHTEISNEIKQDVDRKIAEMEEPVKEIE